MGREVARNVSGRIDYAWDKEKCPYEMWNDLPEIYSCEQAKEIPLLIINGNKDKLTHIYGQTNAKYWLENVPPIEFAARYFREKYNCNPSNTKGSY